ncbi:hypothetical protein ACFV9D_13095 [Streptomyces sp. NPDC059875]|uniref:hypothetical protein n=1 Tax=unclassified Streptomyces TaxID=2593676 RepID=UPI0036636574
MPWKHTSSLLAVVVAAGLTLTACSQEVGSDAKGGSSASSKPSTAAAEPSDSAEPSDASGAVEAPKDLPAGLPLPEGELTSVTGNTGAYVLTYRTEDSKAVLDQYRKALEGADYTVVDIAGTFTATSGANAVQITTSGDLVILTLAGS